MARYRQTTSASGSYFDRATDQIQVGAWLGACGYDAFNQTGEVVPVLLAPISLVSYSLSGYTKYVAIHVEKSRDGAYLNTINASNSSSSSSLPVRTIAYRIRWFAGEQRKFFRFDERVFVFMLSLALIVDQLTPMLWVFATSQVFIGS